MKYITIVLALILLVQAMRQRGSRRVDLITPDALKGNDEKLGHLGCFIYSMEYAAKWFADVSENLNRN